MATLHYKDYYECVEVAEDLCRQDIIEKKTGSYDYNEDKSGKYSDYDNDPEIKECIKEKSKNCNEEKESQKATQISLGRLVHNYKEITELEKLHYKDIDNLKKIIDTLSVTSRAKFINIIRMLITRYKGRYVFSRRKNRLFTRIDALISNYNFDTTFLDRKDDSEIFTELLVIKGGKTRKIKRRKQKTIKPKKNKKRCTYKKSNSYNNTKKIK